MTTKRQVAEAFEAEHTAVVESRGPAPIRPRGNGRSRPIIVTDAEGNPKRIATHDRLLEGLLEREGVNAVVEGRRPRVVRCVICGGPKRVGASGVLPSRCDKCVGLRVCASCGQCAARRPAKRCAKCAGNAKKPERRCGCGAVMSKGARGGCRACAEAARKARKRRCGDCIAAVSSGSSGLCQRCYQQRRRMARKGMPLEEQRRRARERQRAIRAKDPDGFRSKQRARENADPHFSERKRASDRAYYARKKAEREAAKAQGTSGVPSPKTPPKRGSEP